MYLSDRDIRAGVKKGIIVISDFDESRLQPASYDICLGNKFWVTSSHESLVIDPAKKIFPKLIEKEIPENGEFYLHPGVTVLAYSRDYFGSSKYLVHLSGKSSLARLGLVVHNTAGLINPGHFLNITFELCNFNKLPFVLRPGMPIAQILFSKLTSDPEHSYEGRYNNKNHDHFASAAVASASKKTKKGMK